MSNAFRVWNDWVSVSSQAAMVAVETQSVIALRLMHIAAGGALARSEPTRMGAEKVQALGEAQAVAPVGSMTGRNRRHVAKKSMTGRIRRRKSMAGRNRRHIAKKAAGVYKKRVRGNRRRLAR